VHKSSAGSTKLPAFYALTLKIQALFQLKKEELFAGHYGSFLVSIQKNFASRIIVRVTTNTGIPPPCLMPHEN
jgi:hypothetical protein